MGAPSGPSSRSPQLVVRPPPDGPPSGARFSGRFRPWSLRVVGPVGAVGASWAAARLAPAPSPHALANARNPLCRSVRLGGDFAIASIARPPFLPRLHGQQEPQGHQPPH